MLKRSVALDSVIDADEFIELMTEQVEVEAANTELNNHAKTVADYLADLAVRIEQLVDGDATFRITDRRDPLNRRIAQLNDDWQMLKAQVLTLPDPTVVGDSKRTDDLPDDDEVRVLHRHVFHLLSTAFWVKKDASTAPATPEQAAELESLIKEILRCVGLIK